MTWKNYSRTCARCGNVGPRVSNPTGPGWIHAYCRTEEEKRAERQRLTEQARQLAARIAAHKAGVALPTGPRNGLAQIEGDSIVIRLTADACAFAFVNDPQAQEPRPPVIDKQAFLRDTFNALTAEGEDGSTPLTDVLDKAMVRAMEDGSDALDHDAAGVAPTHGGEHG
jgi:hypothetical protein